MRFVKNKKGIFGLDDFLALMAFSGLFVLITFSTLKYHINNVLQFENKYNTADLTMLALLSMKYKGNDMPLIISQHLVYDEPSDISFLNKYLDEFIQSKCYELRTSGASNAITLTTTTTETQTQAPPQSYSLSVKSTASENSCVPDSISTANLVLPYNPQKLTEKLELKIS